MEIPKELGKNCERLRASSYNNPAICIADVVASSTRGRMPTTRCLKLNSVLPLIAEDGI